MDGGQLDAAFRDQAQLDQHLIVRIKANALLPIIQTFLRLFDRQIDPRDARSGSCRVP